MQQQLPLRLLPDLRSSRCTGVDNLGPPTSVAEIESSLQAVRDEYPGAEVVTSTFDDFIRDVEPVKEQLPVVTAEAGKMVTLSPFVARCPSR